VEASILTSVKKSLGLEEDYVAFDPEIVLFINSVLSTLNQIGVGPENGFQIEDKAPTWDELLGSDLRLNNVKAYVYLKVRMLFDPPSTSFAIEALESQSRELETRIYIKQEADKWT
jgi:hypothetical protein